MFTRGQKCVSCLEMRIFASKLDFDLDVKFERENTVKTRREAPCNFCLARTLKALFVLV